jgi:hypothetical protein
MVMRGVGGTRNFRTCRVSLVAMSPSVALAPVESLPVCVPIHGEVGCSVGCVPRPMRLRFAFRLQGVGSTVLQCGGP